MPYLVSKSHFVFQHLIHDSKYFEVKCLNNFPERVKPKCFDMSELFRLFSFRFLLLNDEYNLNENNFS